MRSVTQLASGITFIQDRLGEHGIGATWITRLELPSTGALGSVFHLDQIRRAFGVNPSLSNLAQCDSQKAEVKRRVTTYMHVGPHTMLTRLSRRHL